MLGKKYFVFIIILIFTFGAYFNAIENEFIGDDIGRIVYSQKFLEQGLQSSLRAGLGDRPALMTTIWLNYKFGHLNPVGYKIVSLFFHALVGFFIFLLFIEFAEDKNGRAKLFGLLAACLFVIHPMNNFAVNSVIQRGIIQATLCSLISILFFIRYLKSDRKNLLYLSYLIFAVGILSKSNCMFIPAGLFLYQRLFAKDKKVSPFVYLGYLLISLIPFAYYFLLKLNVQVDQLTSFQYFLTELKVVFIYWRLFFVPVNLRFLYAIAPGLDFSQLATWMYLLGHAAAIAVFVYLWKSKRKTAFFFLSLCYLNLIPESSFFPIHHVIFEHRTYLPFLFAILFFARLLNDSQIKIRVVMPVFAVIAGCFLYINLGRNREINTFAKWVMNTISYVPSDPDYNIFHLTEFLFSDTANGYVMAEKLVGLYPEDRIYGLYYRSMKYSEDRKNHPELSVSEEQKKADAALFKDIQAVLIDADIRLHSIARAAFNRFYFSNIANHYEPQAVAEKIDDTIYPQLPLLQKQSDFFEMTIFNYSRNLRLMKERYETQGLKVENDGLRYMRVLIVLERFYHEVSHQYVVSHMNEVKTQHPSWKKAAEFEANYLSTFQ